MDTVEVNVKAYSKKNHELIKEKVMTIKQWDSFNKISKSFYYRAYQIN